MRIREVLALLQHPSVPRDAVVEPGSRTVKHVLRKFKGEDDSLLDQPFLLASGKEVTAVYVGDRQLRMSDPL